MPNSVGLKAVISYQLPGASFVHSISNFYLSNT